MSSHIIKGWEQQVACSQTARDGAADMVAVAEQRVKSDYAVYARCKQKLVHGKNAIDKTTTDLQSATTRAVATAAEAKSANERAVAAAAEANSANELQALALAANELAKAQGVQVREQVAKLKVVMNESKRRQTEATELLDAAAKIHAVVSAAAAGKIHAVVSAAAAGKKTIRPPPRCKLGKHNPLIVPSGGGGWENHCSCYGTLEVEEARASVAIWVQPFLCQGCGFAAPLTGSQLRSMQASITHQCQGEAPPNTHCPLFCGYVGPQAQHSAVCPRAVDCELPTMDPRLVPLQRASTCAACGHGPPERLQYDYATNKWTELCLGCANASDETTDSLVGKVTVASKAVQSPPADNSRGEGKPHNFSRHLKRKTIV